MDGLRAGGCAFGGAWSRGGVSRWVPTGRPRSWSGRPSRASVCSGTTTGSTRCLVGGRAHRLVSLPDPDLPEGAGMAGTAEASGGDGVGAAAPRFCVDGGWGRGAAAEEPKVKDQLAPAAARIAEPRNPLPWEISGNSLRTNSPPCCGRQACSGARLKSLRTRS